MKETCAEIPFQNLWQGSSTHWLNVEMGKWKPSLPLKNGKLHETANPYPHFLLLVSSTVMAEDLLSDVMSLGSTPYLCKA